MKKVKTRGTIPPIMTPMSEGEAINEGELRNQVNRQINGRIYGLFPFGANEEGYILGEVGKEQVLSTAIDETKGRVPVYAGAECINTRNIIRQSGMAKSLGAGVLSIITPSFAAASQDELHEHYKAMVRAVDIPIVLHDIPTKTGNSLVPTAVAHLSKIENIAGAKDSLGNFDNMLQYIKQARGDGDFAAFSGNDSLILWSLLTEGTDDTADCANAFLEVMAPIYDSFATGDLGDARKVQNNIQSFRAYSRYNNPNTIVKTTVALLGYPVGKCHAPLNRVPEEGIETLRKILTENHEKGIC